MITVTLIEDSTDGKFTHQGELGFEHSEHVHRIEISALWDRVKGDTFKKQVRERLYQLCEKQGMPAEQILLP